jgi:hypothetical protein
VTRGDNRALCDPPTSRGDIIGVVREQWAAGEWVALAAAPSPRLPRLTAANDGLVIACMRLHFDFARRVAGTTLHLGRFYRMGTAAVRSLSAPRT